ncbi:unnamed protein product, partial [marine sediment metagenome]
MIETLRHQEAFEYYYILGDKRKLVEVARQFNVSVQSTNRWNKEFGWQGRIVERDNKIAHRLAEKINTKLIRDKVKDLQLVEIAKTVWAQQLTGEIKIECPSCKHKHSILIPNLKAQFRDLDTFIRLSEFLSGEADSRPEQVIRLEYV